MTLSGTKIPEHVVSRSTHSRHHWSVVQADSELTGLHASGSAAALAPGELVTMQLDVLSADRRLDSESRWQVGVSEAGAHVHILKEPPMVGGSMWIYAGEALLECVRRSGVGHENMFRRLGMSDSESILAESAQDKVCICAKSAMAVYAHHVRYHRC